MSALNNPDAPASRPVLCKRCLLAGRETRAERNELCLNCIKELQDNAAIITPPREEQKESGFAAKPHPYARHGNASPPVRTPPQPAKSEPRQPTAPEEIADIPTMELAAERMISAANQLKRLAATEMGRKMLRHLPGPVRRRWVRRFTEVRAIAYEFLIVMGD